MASPGGPGADAAYDRAVAAFQQGAYDVARRWALEALAQDASHDRARALLGRLDAVRRPTGSAPLPRTPAHAGQGSEVVSTDPTVLISRASKPATEGIEPTVLIRHDDPHPRRGDTDVFAPVAPRGAAVSEPTMIVQRQPRTTSPPPPPPSGGKTAGRAAGAGWFSQLFQRRAPRPPARGASANTRGILVAVAAVAVAAVLLVGGIAAARWLWPSGQVITLTRPTGGTILGPGLECGTRGTDCEASRPKGEAVELTPQADDNYVFSGFTGDCAPFGRVLMNEPKKCGATFTAVAAPPPAVTFPLTIEKPVGGTIIGPNDIICGSLGAVCSASMPTGQQVTLRFQADTGYTFGTFTGECSAGGELTMTGAKTCGATFIQAQTANNPQDSGTFSGPRPRSRGSDNPPERVQARVAPPKSAVAPPVADAVVPPPGPPGGVPTSSDQSPTPTAPDKPAAPPETAEDHAKKEIEQLVNKFCTAYESRDPDVVQKLWPLAPMPVLHDQFRQYKTLRCTITSPPKFDRLDARPAGGAQLEFGMKQEIEMRSGGAPQVRETIVTMVVSRIDFQNPWLVDRVRARPKPKD